MMLATVTPEVVNAYFTPLDYILYLFAILVLMIVYYQWRWASTCKNKVLVLVVHSDGSSHTVLVDKQGASVTLTNPKTGSDKLWPINKLATIDVLYPGVGFVPEFLQKQIRMTIVDEDDWEPLINRSPNREMIASPAVLGNLMHEKVTEAVITVNKEMLDSISGLMKRLNKLVNPLVVYIGLGLCLIISLVTLYTVMPITEQFGNIELIKIALGITGP